MRYFQQLLFAVVLMSWLIAGYGDSNPLIPSAMLSAWGYKTVKLRYPLRYCDTALENRTSRRAQSIRSHSPVTGEANTYYRYTIIRERFATTAAALQRLAALRRPSRRSIKYSKSCELLTGFNIERDVYLIHTDVYMFANKERKRILKLLKQYAQSTTKQN